MTGLCESVERLSLGAYVLGALDPTERAEVDEHLAECESCRDELNRLAVLPGLLSRVRLEEALEPLPEPTPAMAERVIAKVRAARAARRRRVTAGAAALAVAACAALAVVFGVGGDGDGSGTGTPAKVVAASNSRTGVSAEMRLNAATWGTAVHVRINGVAPGTRCRLVAYGPGGREDVAGSWRASYSGGAEVDTATAIPVRDLRALEITTLSDRPLLRTAVD